MNMERMKKALMEDMQVNPSGPGRQKTWDECGIEEKVNRLRGALRDLRWGVQDARRFAGQFENHKHDALGEVVVPIRSHHGEGEASSLDLLV